MLPNIKANIQQLRDTLYQYKEPIYFIDWAVFVGIGIETHLPNAHFIVAADTFQGMHPQVFVPTSYTYNHLLDTIDIVKDLLRNEEVKNFIKHKGAGKMLTWFFDEEIEKMAYELHLEICLPPATLRAYWDNKANTNRLAERAGVPCVPYILSTIESYAHLRLISANLGEQLVVQMPQGMGGETTFFINNEEDFKRSQHFLTNGEEMKIMRYIRCRQASQEACIIANGTVVAPLLRELIGIPELTLYQGGWCGNELLPNAFPTALIQQAKEYSQKLGEQLRKEGYKGCFQPDYLIDETNGTLYLGEINTRFCGFTPLVNNASIAQRDIPLLLLHLAEWLEISYEIDVESLNAHWINQDFLVPMSIMYFTNTKNEPVKPIPFGIYKIKNNGEIHFVRHALSPQAIEDENEFFCFSSASKDSKVENKFDMGGFFIHSTVTIDGKNLTKKAKAIIDGILKIL